MKEGGHNGDSVGLRSETVHSSDFCAEKLIAEKTDISVLLHIPIMLGRFDRNGLK